MSDETAAQRMQARRDWRALREEDRTCEHCGFHSPNAMICGECEAYSKGFDAGLASAITDRDSARLALGEVTAERDCMRNAILTMHRLQLSRRDDERHAWAIRDTANYLSEPFTYGRVQAKYDETSEPRLRDKLDAMTIERDQAAAAERERIADWLEGHWRSLGISVAVIEDVATAIRIRSHHQSPESKE